MSHTRYEWTLIDYAIWTAGAVTVPVYETSSAEQAEWILSTRARGLASSRPPATRRRSTASGTGCRRSSNSGGSTRHRLDSLRAAGADVGDEVITERAAAAKASDLATVIYTSGTTGRPKGCELTHENLLADVRNAFHGPLITVAETAEPARCCSCRSRTSSPGSSRWAASRAASCSGTAGT